MPGLMQGLQGVDHGQPGADDQHPRIHCQAPQSFNIPRVQRRRIQPAGLALGGTGGREHPGGQHGCSSLPLAAVAKGHCDPLFMGLQVHHRITDVGQG